MAGQNHRDPSKIASLPLSHATGQGEKTSLSRMLPGSPSSCEIFPIRIGLDGTWYYHDSPIRRKPLVRLFASVLKRHGDGTYWLETPFERGRITVDDAPFLVTALTVNRPGPQQEIFLTTNLDDTIRMDAAHPLRIEGTIDAPRPYVTMADGIPALVARPVYYQLVELATIEVVDGAAWYGVHSAGGFFPLGPAA